MERKYAKTVFIYRHSSFTVTCMMTHNFIDNVYHAINHCSDILMFSHNYSPYFLEACKSSKVWHSTTIPFFQPQPLLAWAFGIARSHISVFSLTHQIYVISFMTSLLHFKSIINCHVCSLTIRKGSTSSHTVLLNCGV